MSTVNPQTVQIRSSLLDLADEIQKLAEIGTELANSRLKSKAILLLVSNITGLPQRDVKKVLESLPTLRKEFLKN